MENGMGKNNKQKTNKHQQQQQTCYNNYKCIMANASAMWREAVQTKYQLYLLAAQQEPYKNKTKSLSEKCWRIFWKMENDN